jgi:hypothetical protein
LTKDGKNDKESIYFSLTIEKKQEDIMKKFLFAVLAICFVCVQVVVVSDSNAGSIQAQAKTTVQDWKVAPKKVVSNLLQSSSIGLGHNAGNSGNCSYGNPQPKISGDYCLEFRDSRGTLATEYLGRDHEEGNDCPEWLELLLADGNVSQGILVMRANTVLPKYNSEEYKWYMLRYDKHNITSDLLGFHPRQHWWNTCHREAVQIKYLTRHNDYMLLIEEGKRVNDCDEGWIESVRITLYRYRQTDQYLFDGGYFNDRDVDTHLYERAIEKIFIYNGKTGNSQDRPSLVVKDEGQYKALKEGRVDVKTLNNRFVVSFTGGDKSQSFYLKTLLK